MTKLENLLKYIRTMLLDAELSGNVLVIDNKQYLVLEDELILDEDGEFAPITNEDVDGFVYEFGGRWYTQLQDEEFTLSELCYIGTAKEKVPTKSFLGIRSGYELMNGMGLYKDWIAKGKFLGCETLGICERNTLGGVLAFQNECKNNGIKSIIGMTVSVKGNDVFDLKLYAKNFQGWLNLLKFNEIINVDEKPFVELDTIKNNLEGLFVVVDPKSMNFKEDLDYDYYQLETVQYLNEDTDRWFINNLESFLKSDKSPISITDAFYLEQRDCQTREALWIINKSFDDKTNNQYFKSKTQYAGELLNMFDKEDKSWIELYKTAQVNENELIQGCTFEYDTDTRHLPRYIMTEEESSQFDTNEELFLHLVKKGFKDRKVKDANKYLDRLKKEIEVLKMGDVIDYFLSLHDIIRYAKSKDMLTGIGRGSAGGSLVAYLLGIIQVDPLRFDLLFERFLNSGRMGKFEDRPLFILEDDKGNKIELIEGSLVKIKRNNSDMIVFVHELLEGDEIIKY